MFQVRNHPVNITGQLRQKLVTPTYPLSAVISKPRLAEFFFKVGICLLFAWSLVNVYSPLAYEHNGGKQMLCMYLGPFYPRYTKEKQTSTVQKDSSLPAKASACHHVSPLAQKYLLHLPSHNPFLSCFMKSRILFLSGSSLLPSLIPSVTPSAFHPVRVVYFG